MSTQLINQALRFAHNQIGQNYVWGGDSRSEGGFDCSGLIYAAYRAAGYTGIGRTTQQQIKQGIRVDPRHIQAGDLVFSSPGHVGVYAGNGMIISSPHTGAEVHQIPLSQFGGIYQIRRLSGGGGGVHPPQAGQMSGGGGAPHMSPMNFTPLQMPALQPLQLPTPQQVLSLGQPAQPAQNQNQPTTQLPQLPVLGQNQPSLDALRQSLFAA